MQNDTCYILALIKRDDGERLLLGSGFYEFVAGQKHFNPNQFANDVVELQGTDGQLLAGQVRRSTTQTFEGFIGDGTTSKQTVEQKRREFFLFFRKQHHYTVVYIMPDGTAIKRDRGYITEAPAVQELHQFQPKWRIGLAFEDVNYYSYNEDAQGNEIYSYDATLSLANIADGGLVWDDKGATSDTYVHTGKNLFDNTAVPYQKIHTVQRADGDKTFIEYTSGTGNYHYVMWRLEVGPNEPIKPGETYTLSCEGITTQSGNTPSGRSLYTTYSSTGGNPNTNLEGVTYPDTKVTFTVPNNATSLGVALYTKPNDTWQYDKVQLEKGSNRTAYEAYSRARSKGGYVFAPSTGGGPIVVTVNGVDNANPVWHVYGPATNPTLTNSTTGEALTWNGTVPANQELIIDMGAQTATLEGANVFEYVSGSWVQLEPGANRVSYTAANTTKNSKIFWNEVVG
jgi:hypothetical protein